ncbi:MAG: hypothetical protein RR817_10200 [Niameybacter sp.]
MIVENNKPIQHFTANGSTNIFTINFVAESKHHLKITVDGNTVPINDYSYNNSTNTVFFHIAPLNGVEIVVEHLTNLEHSINYETYNNGFRPKTLNYDLDKIWHSLQEENIVDVKILARLKDEIEWRRTHSLSYDDLSKVRDKQVVDALKGYTDTLFAATHPNVFKGVTAGVVFALDGVSIQTHLEKTLKDLIKIREQIKLKANKTYVDDFQVKINKEVNLKANKAYVDAALASFQNDTVKVYPTLIQANADIANIELSTKVEVLSITDGGSYYKESIDAVTLTKSPYDLDFKVRLLEGDVHGYGSQPYLITPTMQDGYVNASGAVQNDTLGYERSSAMLVPNGVEISFDYYGGVLSCVTETDASESFGIPLVLGASLPDTIKQKIKYKATADTYIIICSRTASGALNFNSAFPGKVGIIEDKVGKNDLATSLLIDDKQKAASSTLTKELKSQIDTLSAYISPIEKLTDTVVGGFRWTDVSAIVGHNVYGKEITLLKGDVLTFKYTPIEGATLWDWREPLKGFPLLSSSMYSEAIKEHTFTAYGNMTVRIVNSVDDTILVNGEPSIINNLGAWGVVQYPIDETGGGFVNIKRSLPLDVKKGDKVTITQGALGALSIIRRLPGTNTCISFFGESQLQDNAPYVEWVADADNTIFLSGMSDAEFFIQRKGMTLNDRLEPKTNIATYIDLPPIETVFATSMNYILKTEVISGIEYICISENLGKTWTKIQNIIGDVVQYHFFSDGTIMLCSATKVYWTSDYLTLHESTVYDYDGSVFTTTENLHFFSQQSSDRVTYLDDDEIFVWGDYIVSGGIPRIWYSLDRGHTIKCAAKFGTTVMDGAVRPIRHVHRVYFRDKDQCFYITTGDEGAECMIMRAKYNMTADTWDWKVYNSGDEYKFCGLSIDDNHIAYLVSDFTTSGLQDKKGIYRVALANIGDFSKYRLIYKADPAEWGAITTTQLITDKNGNKVLLPDYLGFGMLSIATEGLDFKKIIIRPNVLLAYVIGENYNGDVYCVAYTDVSQLSNNTELKLTRGTYNLTKALRANGIPNFMKGMCLNPTLNGVLD